MEKKNEFKISALRQFGSENLSFTATVHSNNATLSDEEIEAQIKQIDTAITKAFIATQEREIAEKDLLAKASDRRREAVARLDAALKEEMKAKEDAGRTMKDAEKLSKKLGK